MKFKIIAMHGSLLLLSACMEAQSAAVEKEIPSSQFTIETIRDDLNSPWSVAVLPDGGYLVTEIEGRLKHVKGGTATEITGLPDDIAVGGQGGLFDVTLSPNYGSDKLVYLSYAAGTDAANGTAIYKARLEGDKFVGGKQIFKASPTKQGGYHYGGRLAFLPDGSLVLTLGDGFSYREDAQKLGTHLGKIVRIMPDGSTPKDNPFIGEKGKLETIYSYGHRNVQGLAYDSVTGQLWAHEHGARGGDELNLIKPGANYGWPLATTGTDYNGAKITPYKSYEGTEGFVTDWVPSIAPSGLTIHYGEKFKDWNGDALVGALAGSALWRVDLEDGKAVSRTKMLGDLGYRFRDVRTDKDGSILIVTDGGLFLRVNPK